MRTLTPTNPPRPPLFACLPSREVLDHVASVLDPDSMLSGRELARAEALISPNSRRDFVAARVLTRLLLRRWHDPGAALTSIADIVLAQTCTECGGPHGRPADVFGLGVSWAHAGGFVAAAVGRGPVGVDVEPAAPDGAAARAGRRADGRTDGRAVVLGRPTSVRAWVRGEAILKWGHGTLDDALGWLPELDGRLATRGQQYVMDDEGRPRRTRRRVPAPSGLVLTDAPTALDGAVCSVAAGQAAGWVNPAR
ncbi:hypothetical protein [Pedococcus bigeumensis]|uniref:4'-phosphopantetheinyl transferase n=1 Tax=Pedococcus bigeumensis TaxID=433644 RepID=A0A502D1C1_9MICO|nr:hypothetical protein [Pedococcus bigeumensis]TPG18179.1 hypothetical protein EAH86_07255 [Pedococcus bigeumensis]